jgi:hypothetical protein
MTFQAYLDSIKSKTGKTPQDFKDLAAEADVYSPDMKAEKPVTWLHDELDLGRGHFMALWAVFKSKGWVHAAGGGRE